MITVHHLNMSRSHRILWMLEEVGVDYEIQQYMRNPKTMRAPDSLKAVHPLGKSPVITDGTSTMAESGAILEYLADTYGAAMKPEAGSESHRRYVYWLHFAEGSLMPPLLVKLITDKVKEAKLPFFVKPVAKGIADKISANFTLPEIERLLGFVNAELADAEWFAGDAFSGADVQMSYPLEAAYARGTVDDGLPHIVAWIERIRARPAYKRALERGGEYLP